MSDNNVASRGDFRGDFSRDTFDPMKQFSRVLMQQGRVQLDADWNEQVSILLHYMRQLGADLMGPHGAPADDEGNASNGFNITADGKSSDFSIGSGAYYVNGIRCENEKDVLYSDQPNYPFTEDEKKKLFNNTNGQTLSYLVYLDGWERHLSYVEDDCMREKALGGADTATRAKVVWQVKVTENLSVVKKTPYNDFLKVLPFTREDNQKPKLKARAKKPSGDDNKPCLSAPEASYRGVENQLYRVEIHDPGAAGTATFKWSRENGSMIFPITNISDGKITLEHLGRDDRFGLQPGDWVEVLDDVVVLRNESNLLLKVTAVDRENLQVTLSGIPKVTLKKNSKGQIEKHPYLRRWDHCGNDANGVTVKEAEGDDWIAIEDGIEIQFQKKGWVYQTGDYWLIPARTATGDVEWPGPVDNPEALPPHGVEHHYAPLAIIKVEGGVVTPVESHNDLRRQLQKSWLSPN